VNLRVFQSIALGQAFVGTIAPTSWRRSIDLSAGSWQGNGTLYGSLDYLSNIFNTYLAYHIEEAVGQKTWEGLMYEMELTTGGITRRRSLDDLANAVKVTYINTSDTQAETTFTIDDESIKQFGRKEEIITGEQISSTTAGYKADTFLQRMAWATPLPTRIAKQSNAAKLDFKIFGYAFTANWRYVTAADDATGNASAWVSNIIGTDLEFISSGTINTNTTQVKRTTPTAARCWNILQDMAEVGDSNSAPWRVYIDLERNLIYEQIDTEISGFIYNGEFYSDQRARKAINPWLLQPGIYRDISNTFAPVQPTAWLADPRDVLVTGIEVDQNGTVRPKL